MTIEKELNDGKLTIRLAGRLDTNTAPELESELKDALEGVSDLTMDFKDLEYISSAGLRVLLLAKKTIGDEGEMKIIEANDTIKEIFDVTGFSDILSVE